MKYLNKKIISQRKTPTPQWGMTAEGYTKRSGAPTSWMIKLEGEKRERRLMVFCFSNSGSLFIKIKGEAFYVKEYELPL